jgi:hypothetical protein
VKAPKNTNLINVKNFSNKLDMAMGKNSLNKNLNPYILNAKI